jgi:thiol-disulfide isomerase/thioredoxin
VALMGAGLAAPRASRQLAEGASRSYRRRMRYSVVIAAVVGLVGCQKPTATRHNQVDSAQATEPGPVKGVDRSHKGQPFPKVSFGDPDGTQTDFKGFEGIPTLVNLWATWCAPCVKELPTLQRLSKQKNRDLWIVPINQDTAPRASVDAFLTEHKLRLPVYFDPKMALSGALGPDTVLPTTILYDASGKEVWRYVGDLDWTSPEAAKLLAEADGAPKRG